MEQGNTQENNYAELSERHRRVLNDIARGMAKYRAYQKEYPTCNSMNSALQQVARILSNPIAQIYLEEQKQHEQRYISENHSISMDKNCSIYAQSIADLQADVKQARAQGDYNAVAKLETVITNKQIAHEKLTGMGAHSPIYRLQEEKRLAQQEKAIKGNSATNKQLGCNADDSNQNSNINHNNDKNGISNSSTNVHSFMQEIIETVAEECTD